MKRMKTNENEWNEWKKKKQIIQQKPTQTKTKCNATEWDNNGLRLPDNIGLVQFNLHWLKVHDSNKWVARID